MLLLYVAAIGLCIIYMVGSYIHDVLETRKMPSELSGKLLVTGKGEIIVDEKLVGLRHRRDRKHVVEVCFKPEEPSAACVPHNHDQLRWELVERRRRSPREAFDLDLKIWWHVHAERTIVWKITFID